MMVGRRVASMISLWGVCCCCFDTVLNDYNDTKNVGFDSVHSRVLQTVHREQILECLYVLITQIDVELSFLYTKDTRLRCEVHASVVVFFSKEGKKQLASFIAACFRSLTQFIQSDETNKSQRQVGQEHSGQLN
jgi:hypothetical protein